jgi:hypothetical protein
MTASPARASRPPRRDSLFFPAFDACPGCGGALRSASIVDLSVFFCAACQAYWHIELGVVYRVTIPPAAAHS